MFQDIFTTTIYQSVFNFDLENLTNYAIEIEKNNYQVNRSNKGGFQSSLLDFNQSPIKDVCDAITHEVNFYCKYLQIKPADKEACWININRYKDYNIMHHHTPGYVSAVFYIKVPDNDTSLVFEDPSRDSKIIDWSDNKILAFNKNNSNIWKITPVENSCCIFPSWLNHCVEPNLTSEDRISLAINFKVVL